MPGSASVSDAPDKARPQDVHTCGRAILRQLPSYLHQAQRRKTRLRFRLLALSGLLCACTADSRSQPPGASPSHSEQAWFMDLFSYLSAAEEMPAPEEIARQWGAKAVPMRSDDRHVAHTIRLPHARIETIRIRRDQTNPRPSPSAGLMRGAEVIPTSGVCLYRDEVRDAPSIVGWKRPPPPTEPHNGNHWGGNPGWLFHKRFQRQRLVLEFEEETGETCLKSALFLWHMTAAVFRKYAM